MTYPNDDPECNISGECQPYEGSKKISNCIHCGKELIRDENGEWKTWEEFLPEDTFLSAVRKLQEATWKLLYEIAKALRLRK